MKKKISIIIAIIMIIGILSACQSGKVNDNQNGPSDNLTEDQSNGNDNETDSTDSVDNPGQEIDKDNNTDNNNDNNSNEPTDDNDDNNSDNAATELISTIDKIYGIKDPGLMVMSTPVDLTNSDAVKYNTGIDDVSKVKEAVVSEAMINAQAYSLVLVRVNDAADAEGVANEMLKGIDPAKWICVNADDLQVAAHDDMVLLIMVSSELSDSVTSQEIIDAFKELSGGQLDLELQK